MVSDSLSGVIKKYRKNRSAPFPIPAFHSYKYGDIALQDALAAGNGRLTTQQIIERQAQANQAIIDQVRLMVDTLRARGEIEIFNPASARLLNKDSIIKF